MRLGLFLAVAFVVVMGVGARSLLASTPPAFYEGIEPGTFMTRWLLLGPIPVRFEGEPDPTDEAAQRAMFDADLLAAAEGETNIAPVESGPVAIGGEEYVWRYVESGEDTIDLTTILGAREFVVAYAWAEIDVSEATEVLLGVGSDDAIKIWLNGQLVHDLWAGRSAVPDDDLVPVTFQAGRNRLLLKIQNRQQDWGFVCRVIDPSDAGPLLLRAAQRGDLGLLKTLLEHGVDPNAPTGKPLSAVQIAKMRGREAAVTLLVEHGADPNVTLPPMGEVATALFKQALDEYGPGAAVLVARNGEVLYEAGFGYADIEQRIPITPETTFRIGSITKQFTAAAILKLQEEGRLSVNDRLSTFFPDFPRGDEVTIVHLLTHTSGIHSYTSKPDFKAHVTEPIEPEALIASIAEDPYDFDPGTAFAYNNSGYFLLGEIVAKVSGMSYADFLRERFFEPLGMKDTGVHRPGLGLEHEAKGYVYEEGKVVAALDWDMSHAGGAGALYSTVRDLLRWNEAVFSGKVLRPESLEAALTPATLKDGSPVDLGGSRYGFGWMIDEMRGLPRISHGGGLDGFSSMLAWYPDQKVTVVVLYNWMPMAPGQVSANTLAELFLWEEMTAQESVVEVTVDPALYDDYVGRYAYGPVGVLLVTREGDRLFAQLTGQPRFEIFPKSETEFFWKVVEAQITFVKDETGKVTYAIHQQGGRRFEAPKLDDTVAEVDPSVYDAYVGDYDYGAAGVLHVTKEGNHLFAQMNDQPKFEIFPKSETEFFWRIANARITFIKDGTGKVVKAVHHQAGLQVEAMKVK